MTIHNRFKLIGFIVITLLIILSSYFFITSYLNFKKAQALKTILTNNSNLSSILVDIGKERGLTSMYLGSHKQEFIDSLHKQRESTDQTLTLVKQALSVKNMSDIPLLFTVLKEENLIDIKKYKQYLSKSNMLPLIRKEIDDNNPDFKKIFLEGYVKNFSTPTLDNLLQINHFALNTEISSLTSILSKLYIAKENTALERDFVTYYMTQKISMSLKEIDSWDEFRMKSNIFDYQHISNLQLEQRLTQIFNTPKNIELLMRLIKTSSKIRTDANSGNYTVEIIDWFSQQTQKISLLSKVENIITNTLEEKSNEYLQKQLFLLILTSFICLLSFILSYLGFITTRNIIRNIQELEDMQRKPLLLSYKPSYNHLHTNETISTQEKNSPSHVKKILIGKKLLLESKILIKVIENLGYPYIALDNLDKLDEEISSGKYDIVFTDKTLITSGMKEKIADITIITNSKSKEEIEHLILKQRS